MRWWEKHDIDCIFGVERNEVLARRIELLVAKAEQAFEKAGKKLRLFSETEYAAALGFVRVACS